MKRTIACFVLVTVALVAAAWGQTCSPGCKTEIQNEIAKMKGKQIGWDTGLTDPSKAPSIDLKAKAGYVPSVAVVHFLEFRLVGKPNVGGETNPSVVLQQKSTMDMVVEKGVAILNPPTPCTFRFTLSDQGVLSFTQKNCTSFGNYSIAINVTVLP